MVIFLLETHSMNEKLRISKVSNEELHFISFHFLIVSKFISNRFFKYHIKNIPIKFNSNQKKNHFVSALLPDAIQTDCSKCTADQKRNSKKIINFLRTRRPADWKALKAKYDPESKYLSKLTGY